MVSFNSNSFRKFLRPLFVELEDVATARAGYARLLCDIAAFRAAETAAANGDGEAALFLQDLPWR